MQILVPLINSNNHHGKCLKALVSFVITSAITQGLWATRAAYEPKFEPCLLWKKYKINFPVNCDANPHSNAVITSCFLIKTRSRVIFFDAFCVIQANTRILLSGMLQINLPSVCLTGGSLPMPENLFLHKNNEWMHSTSFGSNVDNQHLAPPTAFSLSPRLMNIFSIHA